MSRIRISRKCRRCLKSATFFDEPSRLCPHCGAEYGRLELGLDVEERRTKAKR
jgi:hypothetical protein